MFSRASVRWRRTTRRWAASTWMASLRLPVACPQIEVTFDIDANGIVNVSAKDLGTGKEQKITITSSTNLSKEDIDKAVKEAEQFAEQDKKRHEEIDARNNAENLAYSTEKSLNDLGDKVTEEEKKPITEQIEKLKEALKGTDIEAIKRESEELTKRYYPIVEKVYKEQAEQNGAQGQPEGAANQGQGPEGNVYDADYKVVDDDEKKD